MSRYLIGIDLGTTNSVMYFIDQTAAKPTVEKFAIPQLTAPGEWDECDSLPSFVWLPSETDRANGRIALPWDENPTYSVGTAARDMGAQQPGQVIHSAKSWLCTAQPSPEEPNLPWQSPITEKWSALKTVEAILGHLKAAWNDRFTEAPMQAQDLVITVPASFDAAARELTLEAAANIGLKPTLLEEPLAAFYHWLEEKAESWREQLEPGDVVLICDLGGGTTDFSLIQVLDKDGNIELERVAVGEHILLGGDNMDLAIAYRLAARLQTQGHALNPQQMQALTHSARKAKETLLNDPEAGPQPVTVLGGGSKLIGGTISTELTFEDLQEWLLEGFFPPCDIGEPLLAPSQAGLRQIGLPYASDPAITRHLSAFLLQHAEICLPNAIFFNGGVTRGEMIRDRVLNTLQGWLDEDSPALKVLTGSHPDLAVASGAAIYGRIQQGHGIRVKSGSAHTYYIGIESSMPAIPGFTPPLQGLCVIPFGLEEGSTIEVPYQGLGLVVGQTTTFRLFYSASRNEDTVGTILPDLNSDAACIELPPVSTTLDADETVTPGTLMPITLTGELTETGLLQLHCSEGSGNGQWKLHFDLRRAGKEGETI